MWSMLDYPIRPIFKLVGQSGDNEILRWVSHFSNNRYTVEVDSITGSVKLTTERPPEITKPLVVEKKEEDFVNIKSVINTLTTVESAALKTHLQENEMWEDPDGKELGQGRLQ